MLLHLNLIGSLAENQALTKFQKGKRVMVRFPLGSNTPDITVNLNAVKVDAVDDSNNVFYIQKKQHKKSS